MRLRLLFLSLGFLILMVDDAKVCSQTVTGSISGNVVDADGASVPAAKVTLVNETTSEVRTTQTDATTGAFLFPSVFPGTYSVKVEKEGFETFSKTGNVLTASGRMDLRTLRLSVGSTRQTVTVTAQGATVQSASSERSALLTSTQLGMLSVRGRDVISMLQLLPGVSYRGESESAGDNAVLAPQVHGGREFWNTLMLDGMAGNDVGYPSAFGSSINMDAIGEVKVLLNNFQAEYGRNAGPMVNVVTKAGTRDFHGTGYWYLRNEDLNANVDRSSSLIWLSGPARRCSSSILWKDNITSDPSRCVRSLSRLLWNEKVTSASLST